MSILISLLRRFNTVLQRMSWMTLTVAVSVHFLSSWLLVYLSGEAELAAPGLFWYFYMVTATTVGYGDYSPVTPVGRAVVSFWVMTGAISLFAAVIGKITQSFIALWRSHMRGEGDFSDLHGHTVIVGWHPERTHYMVELLLGDKRQNGQTIVLCAAKDMENPMPEHLKFVRGDSLTSPELLRRAGVEHAGRVIIYGVNDDQTLASGLAVSALEGRAFIVAHFDSAQAAELLRAHCDHAECTTSVSLEMIVRSAQDPGSSRIQTQLLSTLTGPTQFSVHVPEQFAGCDYGQLFYAFKERHNATVFGLAESLLGDDLIMNPPNGTPVKGGQYVYFMSPERILSSEIDWHSITK